MNSKEELIKKLDQEIEELEDQKKANDDLNNFVHKFCLENANLRVSDFDNLDVYNFLVLHFLAMRNDLTLEGTKEILIPIKEIIQKIPLPISIQDLFLNLDCAVTLSNVDTVKELLQLKDFEQAERDDKKKRKIDFRVVDYVISAINIIDSFKLDKDNVQKIIDLFFKYNYEMTVFINVVCITKLVDLIKTKSAMGLLSEKRPDKLEEFIKSKSHTEYLEEQLKKLFDFEKQIQKKESIRISKLQKKQDDLKDFINELDINDDVEITEYRSLLEKINEKFRLDALKVIYEHNEAIYENIAKEHGNLLEDKKIKYQNLLAKYGLKQESLKLEKLINIDYMELENSLEILSKFELTEQTLVYIIENAKYEDIKKINSYFDRGILNKKFIRNNYLIFISNSNENTNLLKNIELLEQENINPNNFALSAKILLIDYKLFFKNVMILKEYNLLTSIKTTQSYNFLQDENLTLKIDKLLELGMEKFLEENLGLLNSKNIDRLYILRELNIPIENIEQLKEFLKLKKFYVPDDKIFAYVFTKKNFNESLEKDYTIDLDKYTKTSRTLDINGVIFSKNKVKRKLVSNSYNDVRCALYSDIYLSNDEYDLVEAALDNDKEYTYKI